MSSNDDMFLTDEQLVKLTGRKFKTKQCEQLKVMGIPFRANAAGKPIVCRVHVEGMEPVANDPAPEESGWVPNKLRGK